MKPDFTITIEAARVNAGKTQTEWAKLIGVSRTTVCNWEDSNKKNIQPNLDQLREIGKLSGIPMDNLVMSRNTETS